MTRRTNTSRPSVASRFATAPVISSSKDATDPQIATSLVLPTSTALRLRSLVEQIYPLGRRPFFELLAEIVGGAPPMERIERYARLNREHGDFIRSNGGDQLPPKFLIVKGND
jgi:hypothetical protein